MMLHINVDSKKFVLRPVSYIVYPVSYIVYPVFCITI